MGDYLGETGLTWHHHQQTGRMILIPSDVHFAAKHTGGHKIWG
ncbi:HNH endonuclease [Lihuaxuella thermophila]|nr:HNH endonuclease [Lihuaxuella thermophila]